MEVIAKINVDTPKGRKIVRELEKSPKVVKVEHPLPEFLQGKKFYTHEEAIERSYNHLSELYGVDFHTLK
ncbi:MAG: hypothetical protein IJW01_00725 [Paludibacteraceae bacterium]|nr:hypothetical protein [Paludibacteraceae bacterium]